jgi:uncharacterized membrane protein (UPF0127 family)
VRAWLSLAVLAVLLGVAVAAGHAQTDATTTLRLDGKLFTPELAITPDQRSLGLMHRRRAPKDGMLFVFREATGGGFWMKNTLVPLTIVFFDSRGKVVRRMSMMPCRRDPCPIYDPGRMYRFALELPANDRRPARQLGPRQRLQQLTAAAR